ncbi:MAG: right-handed parallel beta-helix repeat-containing protein [Bacteroidales bacterium]|jgi:hypothetical protein|nr:right-handed parallel beta-helix repeat-containing protein [Bacteroidales bacterium]
MKYPLIFILTIISMLASCHHEVFLYVSVDGDDRNPGTEAAPFATVKAAQEAVRTIKNPVTVYLRGGTYCLTGPVVFTGADSRTRKTPVTYAAFPGETVKISGAVKLEKLNWETYKEPIMQAKVDQPVIFDQLFVNGEQQRMARYPDYDPAASHYNGTAADAIDPARVARWKNPEGGYVHALHRHEWGGYHWVITGKDDQGELKLEGGYQNNRLMGMHPVHRFVENIFEELDAPGEWFFDKEQQILYFYPPAGIDLATAVIEVPQLKELFVFRGVSEGSGAIGIIGEEDGPTAIFTASKMARHVTYISLEGMELTHTLRTFMDTKEPLLRSDWAIYRSGAVLMENAEYCSIRNCFFNTVGGNAVFMSNYNRHNEVSGCHIANAGASGVCLVGDPGAVRSPSFEYNEYVEVEDMDLTPGPKNDNFPFGCLVYDNLMHDLGRVEKQVAGVQISMAQDITVSHNTIYNVPRAGINIGDGTWGGHIIEYNDVFNTVLETGDHGSFNSWGRDRFWHPKRNVMNERVVNNPDLVLLDAIKTVIIRNNRFRCDHGWDIDLDDGSSNYHIYNNLCLNGGLKLREGFFRLAENNIMVNNSFHPHVWFANSGDVFIRNIVSAGYFPISMNNGWGREIDNNIFPDEKSLEAARKNGTDAHSVVEDVRYLDPAKGDFRVPESSVALTKGFRNFAMDQFGVVSENLKNKAEKIPIPELVSLNHSEDHVYEMLGMKLKNITTLGERSAAGLSDASGVWVVEVLPGSVAEGIIQPNDVIIQFHRRKINHIRDLKEAQMQSGSRKSVTLFRNQKEIQVSIHFNR